MTDKLTDDALEYLHKQIRQRMNQLADYMAEGSCKDYSEYRYLSGKVNGLAEAERELLDLQQRLLDE